MREICIKYTLKNIKSHRGHEGEVLLQGSLHGPNGKVAVWEDGDWGGEMMVNFISQDERLTFFLWAESYILTQKNFGGDFYKAGEIESVSLIPMVVGLMSIEAMIDIDATKATRKGIAYFVSDPNGHNGRLLYSSNMPYTADNVAKVRSEVANLLEIVNETKKMPLISAAEAAEQAKMKQYKKLCKTVTLINVRQEDGSIATLKSPHKYSTQVRKQLEARYGDKLVEIINDRFILGLRKKEWKRKTSKSVVKAKIPSSPLPTVLLVPFEWP